MADYKQSEIAGTRWTRCNRISILNPHSSQGAPSVVFDEEDAIAIGSSIVTLPCSLAPIPFVNFNPSEVIDIYDPMTGEKTANTITMGEIYALMFSAYMTKATMRDQTPPEEPQLPIETINPPPANVAPNPNP